MTGRRVAQRVLAPLLAGLVLMVFAAEIEARGGGGGGRGGGMRGGMGGGMRGGVSRGGPARGGSIRHDRSGGGYRSYERGGSEGWGGGYGERSRDGSFETRRGETIDYSGTVTRAPDGVHREGSWESSSGASGSGSGSVRVEDGRVQSRERTGHVENAKGETMDREVQSERHGGVVEREGKIKTSTGVDAESKGRIKRTDDGVIARGGVVGEDGAAAGTIARKGDQTAIRGAATDGEHVSWGHAHCNNGRCTGGRATVKIDDYYNYPYYYYPYYYGWYSCPYGSVQTWSNRYGTPVYGCANVVVIHTTISLGESDTNSSSSMPLSGSGSSEPLPREAEVSSAPVLMYEVGPEAISYATTYEPAGVYAEKQGQRYFWVPGPAAGDPEAKKAIVTAGAMPEPTANATVIVYEVGKRYVYLTNERPIPGYYAEEADNLFVWIPGVKQPTQEDKALIARVSAAQKSGGKAALDREVRKLQTNRTPPPSAGTEAKAS